MLMFHNTQTQISPCIASKARYAINLKNIQPENTKKCFFQYWERVIDTYAYLIILMMKL